MAKLSFTRFTQHTHPTQDQEFRQVSDYWEDTQEAYVGLRVVGHEPVEDVVEDDHIGGRDQFRHRRQLRAFGAHPVAQTVPLDRRLADLYCFHTEV